MTTLQTSISTLDSKISDRKTSKNPISKSMFDLPNILWIRLHSTSIETHAPIVTLAVQTKFVWYSTYYTTAFVNRTTISPNSSVPSSYQFVEKTHNQNHFYREWVNRWLVSIGRCNPNRPLSPLLYWRKCCTFGSCWVNWVIIARRRGNLRSPLYVSMTNRWCCCSRR